MAGKAQTVSEDGWTDEDELMLEALYRVCFGWCESQNN